MFEEFASRHGPDYMLAQLPVAGPGTPLRARVACHPCANLRGNPHDETFVSAVESVLRQKLPCAPNTVSRGDYRVCWLGPDEWLILTPGADPSLPAEALRQALAGRHASLIDVSGGQISIHLAGQGVVALLSKGCPLDFHPAAFAPGACAQSGLAGTSVLLLREDTQGDDSAAFELIVRRSFAEHLLLWLARSGAAAGIGFDRA